MLWVSPGCFLLPQRRYLIGCIAVCLHGGQLSMTCTPVHYALITCACSPSRLVCRTPDPRQVRLRTLHSRGPPFQL